MYRSSTQLYGLVSRARSPSPSEPATQTVYYASSSTGPFRQAPTTAAPLPGLEATPRSSSSTTLHQSGRRRIGATYSKPQAETVPSTTSRPVLSEIRASSVPSYRISSASPVARPHPRPTLGGLRLSSAPTASRHSGRLQCTTRASRSSGDTITPLQPTPTLRPMTSFEPLGSLRLDLILGHTTESLHPPDFGSPQSTGPADLTERWTVRNLLRGKRQRLSSFYKSKSPSVIICSWNNRAFLTDPRRKQGGSNPSATVTAQSIRTRVQSLSYSDLQSSTAGAGTLGRVRAGCSGTLVRKAKHRQFQSKLNAARLIFKSHLRRRFVSCRARKYLPKVDVYGNILRTKIFQRGEVNIRCPVELRKMAGTPSRLRDVRNAESDEGDRHVK